MRICIDIQATIAQRAGVGRYVKCLVEHLGPLAGEDQLRLFHFDFQRRGMPFNHGAAEVRACRWLPGRAAAGLWKTLNWPPFDWFAGEADLYHFPNFTIPPLSGGRSVVTIHDLSFMRFPEFAETRNRRFLNATIRRTVARADAIITDSQFSAEEIVGILGVDAMRVFPIHLGVDPGFVAPPAAAVAECRQTFGLDRPYLLCVGTIEPRKNLGFLVDVFEKLAGFDGLLVIAGMPGWKYEPILARFAASPAAARIRYLKYVPDQILPALYAGAELFLFPSFYEGFGFPPLEAMACGVPVVSSNGGSLAEVLGDAAVILPATRTDEWLSRISALLGAAGERRAMVERGRALLKRYSWATTARRTWAVFREVAA